MQELSLKIKVYDIKSGEEPPKSGYYYMRAATVEHVPYFEPMYWESEKHAWKTYEDSELLFEPADYYGRYWTEVFLGGERK